MKQTALVTAGTGGIGWETALGLAAAGLAVTVVGRNAERGARAVERINATAPAHPARFMAADLASLNAVRTLADRIASDGPLTVLVNNVGAMFADRQDSVDGIEATFAVNHLSPYLLTELLLPSLRAGAPSRIVNVTSASIGVAKRTFDAVEPPAGTTASTGTAAPSSPTSPTRSTWRADSTARASRSSPRTPAAPRPT